MKRLFLLFALCAVAFSSCNKLFQEESKETTFNITKNSIFNVISLGADIAVYYRVTNPLEGVSVVATPSEDWITEISSLKNAVVFSVAPNQSDAARTATITFVYGDFERVVTINQSAAGSDTAEYTKFEHLSGFYWCKRYNIAEDDHYYSFVMGESGNCRDLATGDLNLIKGKNYLFFDIFSTTAPEKLNLEFNIPVGNYVFDHSNSGVAGTIAEQPTYLYHEDGKSGVMTEFVNGSITVTETTIYANFVDKKGKEYKYCCETRYVDNGSTFGKFYPKQSISTLTGDINATFSNYEAYASCRDDIYLIGKNYWDIFIIDNTTGDCFDIILLSDANNATPTGEFPISTDLTKESIALPGYANCENMQVWSWYTRYTEDRDILGSAPITDGTVTIADNGDNTHTITINVVDDLGNNLTGVCTGEVTTYLR